MKKEITFLMLVKNINLNNKRKIFENAVKQANKISNKFLVVNNNSKDDTKKIIKNISKKYKLDLEYYEDKSLEFDYLKFFYSKKIKTKYIFILDDDEIITDKLVSEIKTNMNKNFKLFIFKWNTYLFGKCITKSTKPILFRNNFNMLSGSKELHKQFNFDKIKKTNRKFIYKSKNEIKHFSFTNIKNLFDKTDFYSKIEAENLYKENKNLNNFEIFLRFFYESFIYFFGTLIFQGGWKNLVAFFYCLNSINYRWKKYFYYVELKNKLK